MIVMKRETPIYCHGEKAVAWFDTSIWRWRCGRCGSTKVRVAT